MMLPRVYNLLLHRKAHYYKQQCTNKFSYLIKQLSVCRHCNFTESYEKFFFCFANYKGDKREVINIVNYVARK